MKAVILVGGLGTRLRPLTLNVPKCMVPVLNKPFLEHILGRLRKFGICEVILAMSHLAPPIQKYFGDGGDFGIDLRYVIEKSPLGTAGAARNALGYIDDACVIMNGDIFTDLDITKMEKSHRSNGAAVTIALTAVANPQAYGLVETKGSRVVRFLEKPGPEQISTNMINAGTYIIEPRILAGVAEGAAVSFERDVFPSLISTGQPVFSFADNSYWIDIGSPQKYLQLNTDLIAGRATSALEVKFSVDFDDRYPGALISGKIVIGENCDIGCEALIKGPSVIGDSCYIGAGSIIENTILWPNVVLGGNCNLNASIIAGHSEVGPGSSLDSVVVGDNILLPPGYNLSTGQIWPDGRH
jgi:mannose-1-phosphate guanylyltransferase